MNQSTLFIVLCALSVGACFAIVVRARLLKSEPGQGLGTVSNTLQSFWLWRSSKVYQRQARYSLPGFMETLAMLLSAGYPLMSALQKIVSNQGASTNPLMYEVREMLRRTRTGENFADALQKLRVALPGAEIAMFVSLLLQANHHGGRLADLLNHQAEVRRQQIAEEIETRAQEAPVRLLLPLIVFIFPATMLPFIGVILGKLMWQN